MNMEYMQRALELARKGLGDTSPNPAVGCVIVKDDKIIGEGFHRKAGEDHAEIIALKQCRESPEGATLYVTLEPCAHQGKTPPCVEAIISSKITTVVIAMRDPHTEASGGVERLKEAGISIEVGLLEQEAHDLNKAWVTHITQKRPYIYLKAAITLDGKIATKSFHSQWISCENSRNWVHRKRAEVDAVLVGRNTVLKDNPQLNSRLGTVKYPTRVVLAHQDSLSRDLKIFNQEGETLVVDGKDLKQMLRGLAEKGITSVLVEGGASVYSQFISQGLVDEFYFFIAPRLVGDAGAISVFHGQSIETMDTAMQLEFTNVEKIGTDVLITARYKQ